MMTRYLPIILLILLGNLWGLAFSLAKIAVQGGIPPVAYAWYQSTGAALLLWVLCRQRGVAIRVTRAHLILFLGSSVLGLVLPNINIVIVTSHLPAGVVSMLVTTVPMISYAIALGLRIEQLRWTRAGGLILGFTGVLFIIPPKSSLPSPDMAVWVVIGLATPLLYGISNIFIATKRPKDTHSLLAAFGMMAMSSVITLPLMLATSGFHPLFVDPSPADWAMLGQTAITAVAFIMYFEILQRAGPVFGAQVGYVVTVFGLFWGWVIFSESHSAWIWAAIICVFAGIALVNAKPTKKAD